MVRRSDATAIRPSMPSGAIGAACSKSIRALRARALRNGDARAPLRPVPRGQRGNIVREPLVLHRASNRSGCRGPHRCEGGPAGPPGAARQSCGVAIVCVDRCEYPAPRGVRSLPAISRGPTSTHQALTAASPGTAVCALHGGAALLHPPHAVAAQIEGCEEVDLVASSRAIGAQCGEGCIS